MAHDTGDPEETKERLLGYSTGQRSPVDEFRFANFIESQSG